MMDSSDSALYFSVVSNDDIEKISVQEITSLTHFDKLQKAIPNSVQDPAFGVTRKGQYCRTCNGDINSCQGHFGNIKLPTTVYNPMFLNELKNILNMICTNCYRIRAEGINLRLFIVQNYLLKQGKISESAKWITFWKLKEQNSIDELSELEAIENEIENFPEPEVVVACQSSELERTKLRKLFMSLISKKNKCTFCHEKLDNFRKSEYGLYLKSDDQAKATVKHDTVDLHNIRSILKKAWRKSKKFWLNFYPIFKNTKSKYPIDMFFMDSILVPPLTARPAHAFQQKVFAHHQTLMFSAILLQKRKMEVILESMEASDLSDLNKESQMVVKLSKGDTTNEKCMYARNSLQLAINRILDSDLKSYSEISAPSGIKQIMEKKYGHFRVATMGKRANYSGRTVITPDPNLNVDEVGIPIAFAKSLTYPVKVTYMNIHEMKKLVLNGPDTYPGAKYIDDGTGKIRYIPAGDDIESVRKRVSLAETLLTPSSLKNLKAVKTVYRHLLNNDMVLMNRQPTLHRPSMLGHKVRVLSEANTVRMHYSNCKGYNADFDGDEMNLHCVQDSLSSQEIENLALVSYHYLTPKNGTPLSGLIQDHIIAASQLTFRDKYFNYTEYMRIVFQGLKSNAPIKLLKPAIWKPQVLWTGRQIISTLLINTLPASKPAITLSSKSQLSFPSRDLYLSDSYVYFRHGELLSGVIDKNQIGGNSFSLIHCVYELYGGKVVTQLLSNLSRMLTLYLNKLSYSLGPQTMILRDDVKSARLDIISELYQCGKIVSMEALKIPYDKIAQFDDDQLRDCLDTAYAKIPGFKDNLDCAYKQKLSQLTQRISSLCSKNGLILNGIQNQLHMMVSSGAKGSMVNNMQITSVFGQIDLEGRRPILMRSGKSLPIFKAHEFAPKAGAYVPSKFLTGIVKWELFFMSSAGREGLIDTAVKTSRSGYLQRCLVKNLEGLVAHYDGTVRDSDGTVIQFLYGEDGLDVSKSQFLNYQQLDFLMANKEMILTDFDIHYFDDAVEKYKKKYLKWMTNGQQIGNRKSEFSVFCDLRNEGELDKEDLIKLWRQCRDKIFRDCKKLLPRKLDPINTKFSPQRNFGSCSDNMLSIIHGKKAEINTNSENGDDFEKMILLKLHLSAITPGDTVGCLAAQSLGEPSTQMTLNTFHFAGSGDQNVTLGIPRLLEILRTASKTIKTPYVEVPFLPVENLDVRAQQLVASFKRVAISDILKYITIKYFQSSKSSDHVTVSFHFRFRSFENYKQILILKPKKVLKFMAKTFFKRLFDKIKIYMLGRSVKIYCETMNVIDNDKDSGLGLKREGEGESVEDGESEANNPPKEDEFSESENEFADEEGEVVKQKFDKKKFVQVSDNEDENLDEFDVSGSSDIEEEVEDAVRSSNSIVKAILNISNMIKSFTFDKENYSWCQIEFEMMNKYKDIKFQNLLTNVANKTLIQEVEGVKEARVYRNNNSELVFKTEGVNFHEVFKHGRLLDLNRLHSNDIHQVAKMYGIEAARNVLIKEVQHVFGVYGISIDFRHISLVADYMVRTGNYVGFNRYGISNSTSLLQKMTFETSMMFMKEGVLDAKVESFNSPSSCIFTGKTARMGTGAFDLITNTSAIEQKLKSDQKKAKRFRKMVESKTD